MGIPYNILINILLYITKITAKIPFSKIYLKTPFIYHIIFYYIFLFFLTYLINKKQINKINKYKNKIIIILLIIFLIPNIIDIIPNGKLNIYFVDVGQVDCTLLITPRNNKILIDGGGSENYNIRKKYIITLFIK